MVDKRGTRDVSEAYLKALYDDWAQELAAQQGYRPRNAKILAAHAASFPQLKLVTLDELGGWTTAQKTHFADGGVFDQIYGKGK